MLFCPCGRPDCVGADRDAAGVALPPTGRDAHGAAPPPRQAGTRTEQHPRRSRPRAWSSTPAATGRGPATDSGRLLCGKKTDGPTEGRILGALGRCAHPGRTLRASRLITGLALEFRRKLPSLPCGVLRGCGSDGVSSTKPVFRSPASLRILRGIAHCGRCPSTSAAPARPDGQRSEPRMAKRRRMRSGTRSLSRRVRRSRIGRREACWGVSFRQAGTRPEQHPAATGRGPTADSGRQLCGKQADGPTEGRLPAPSVGAPVRGAPCGPGV